jgi:hypothetical protein
MMRVEKKPSRMSRKKDMADRLLGWVNPGEKWYLKFLPTG